MENLRIAVVGLGKMGLLHASILNTIPNVDLVALCDKSWLLLKFAKKLFKTEKVVNDVSKLSDLGVNSVYVTTPISSHFGIMKHLLSKRIAENFFVEKTLASSWDESRELCKLTQNFKGATMVGYMKRFSVTFRKAKSMLDQKVLGKVGSFDAYAFSSDFSNVQLGSKKSSLRGGVLRDLGSHVIDLAVWFFGDFEVNSAFSDSIIDDSSEDSVNFEVVKPGLKGQFRVSWCVNKYRMPCFGVTVVGSKGIMKVDDYILNVAFNDGRTTSWFRHDLDDSVNFMLGEPEYYREDAEFVKSIVAGRRTEPSFETASRTDYIIDQVKKEADGNKR